MDLSNNKISDGEKSPVRAKLLEKYPNLNLILWTLYFKLSLVKYCLSYQNILVDGKRMLQRPDIVISVKTHVDPSKILKKKNIQKIMRDLL